MRTTSSVLMWLGGILLACSSPHGVSERAGSAPVSAAQRPPLDPLQAGASIVCDPGPDASPADGPALYMLSAMNHKLAQFPDFAAAIGLDLVSDCDSGRLFMDGYATYVTAHPGFDADEPAAPRIPDEADPTPPVGPAPETTKIADGVEGAVDNPVVHLAFATCRSKHCSKAVEDDWDAGAGIDNPVNNVILCSGTFIARNWILTAAHCLTAAAVDTCMQAGVARKDCSPDWPQWGQWTITGTYTTSIGDGVVGNGDDVAQSWSQTVYARGYVHDNWVGKDPAKNKTICSIDNPLCFDADASAKHDVALLYVPSSSDDLLPPRVEWDGAMRLALVNDTQDNVAPRIGGFDLSIEGWSSNDSGRSNLRTGALRNTDVSIDSEKISVTTTASFGNQRPVWPCPGDSGGPLLRGKLDLQSNLGPRTGVHAVLAVISDFIGGAPPCPSASDPAPPLGTSGSWNATRVDFGLNRDFIEQTFRRWTNYRFFSCAKKGLSNAVNPGITDPLVEVRECWGAPCSNNGPLPDGCLSSADTCWEPARVVASRAPGGFCAACSGFPGLAGSCDCVQGQCLPTQ